MKTKLCVSAVLCVFMLGRTGAWIGFAQPAPQPAGRSPLEEPETIAGLLDLLERDWSGSVGRDQHGHVVKLRLGPRWCNDKNIALVAQIKELRDLTLQGGKPTIEGLRPLRGNTNLCSLHFACFTNLPSGTLIEVAGFPHLTEVHLYYASSTSSEYASLAKMTNLADLQIVSARDFGDAELSRLTDLPSLKNLVARSKSLTESSAALLSQFRVLTNAELRGWTDRTSWSTNWHSGASAVQQELERK